MAKERMEQSRENYESLASDVENSEHLEKSEKTDPLPGVEGLILRLDRRILKLSGMDKQAEKKLKEYMDEGHKEAAALNDEYEHLKSELQRVQKHLDEAKATPYYAYQNEASRQASRRRLQAEVEDAIIRLEEFETSKLGIKSEEENHETT